MAGHAGRLGTRGRAAAAGLPQADLFALVDFSARPIEPSSAAGSAHHVHPALSGRAHALSPLPAADAAGDRAARPRAYDLVHLEFARGRQGRASPVPTSCTSATCTRRCAMPGTCSTSTCASRGSTAGMKSWLARWLLHYLRLWDLRTANGVDHFVANSHFIARRIEKVYRRDGDGRPPAGRHRRLRAAATRRTTTT